MRNFSQPTIVSDDHWVLKGCHVSGSSLSATAEGKLRVLWYAAGEKPEHAILFIRIRRCRPIRSFSPGQLLGATNAHGTPVLLDNAESVMGVWEASENGPAQLMVARFKIKPDTAHAAAKANYRQPNRQRITVTLSA